MPPRSNFQGVGRTLGPAEDIKMVDSPIDSTSQTGEEQHDSKVAKPSPRFLASRYLPSFTTKGQEQGTKDPDEEYKPAGSKEDHDSDGSDDDDVRQTPRKKKKKTYPSPAVQIPGGRSALAKAFGRVGGASGKKRKVDDLDLSDVEDQEVRKFARTELRSGKKRGFFKYGEGRVLGSE